MNGNEISRGKSDVFAVRRTANVMRSPRRMARGSFL